MNIMDTLIRILGVGNVLTSDDGLGPTVIKRLEAKFTFPENVEVIDVGTPGLDFTPYLAGARAVLVVDTVRGPEAAGTIKVWRNEELLAAPPIARTNPHEPGLREALMATELTDSSPGEIVLIGVVPDTVEAGTRLSPPVEGVLGAVEHRVIEELKRLGSPAKQREVPNMPDLWWV